MDAAGGCMYDTWGGYILAYTHLLPLLITLSIWAASITLHGRQWLPIFFGFYLHFCQAILWAIQADWNVRRQDPYCARILVYTFPSQEAFYAAALATFTITYSYLWKVVISWFNWLFLYCLIVVPPLILIWFDINHVWEVAVSVALGIVFTIPFLLIAKVLIVPELKYLLLLPPFSWMGTIDTWCQSKEEREECKYVRECIHRYEKCTLVAVRGDGQSRRGCPLVSW